MQLVLAGVLGVVSVVVAGVLGVVGIVVVGVLGIVALVVVIGVLRCVGVGIVGVLQHPIWKFGDDSLLVGKVAFENKSQFINFIQDNEAISCFVGWRLSQTTTPGCQLQKLDFLVGKILTE